MFEAIKNIFKSSETRKKVMFTMVILLILRVFSNIPVFGINREYLNLWLTSKTYSAFAFMDVFNGSALSNMSLFAVGIGGYISASIIIQLCTIFVPYLNDLTKQGQEGVNKMKKITFYVSIAVSFLQGLMLSMRLGSAGVLTAYNAFYVIMVAVILTFGAMIVYGFSVLIDNKGIGNGTSFIIATNIISGLYTTIGVIYEMFIKGKELPFQILNAIIAIAIISILIIGVIYYNEGEKRLGVTYAGSNKYLPSNKSYLPIKISMSSVMPAIITMSILQLMVAIPSLLNLDASGIAYKILNVFNYNMWFKFDGWNALYNIGVILFILLMVVFNFFYSKIVYNPQIIADNLQKSNGIINGVRQTKLADYIQDKTKNVLILGGLLLSIITLIPIAISNTLNMSIGLGGTSIIILVSVCIEIYKNTSANAQIEQNSNISFYKKGSRKYDK